jgi:hypothetical protein
MRDSIPAKPGFTFGCDPELFVFNSDGDWVSAEGLIPGTKAEPAPVKFGAVQVDGMAAEFNIDPVDNFADWNRNITAVVGQLQKMLPKGHTLRAVPAVEFSEEEWDKAPEFSKELGCSPDFNAWTGGINPPPSCEEKPRLRTASGHLHVGWCEGAELDNVQHLTNCRDLVKQFDWHLGGWSLRIDPDPIRRVLYGKAGACRYKSYGVEYRVLSNFWVLDTDRRLSVWNRMQNAINDMRTHFIPEKNARMDALLIQAINSSTRNAMLEREYRYPIQQAV